MGFRRYMQWSRGKYFDRREFSIFVFVYFHLDRKPRWTWQGRMNSLSRRAIGGGWLQSPASDGPPCLWSRLVMGLNALLRKRPRAPTLFSVCVLHHKHQKGSGWKISGMCNIISRSSYDLAKWVSNTLGDFWYWSHLEPRFKPPTIKKNSVYGINAFLSNPLLTPNIVIDTKRLCVEW